ncbi:MAG: tRNA uridine-5-carboxymethylaminomethyl(34) synthesis GTPase MnmE [Cellvibrionaceae bacterium]
MHSSDTIAAIATAPGRGGVGIIRVSGPKASVIAESITDSTLKPRYAHYGNFIHPLTKDVIDQGLAIYFPNPHSFTGEDVLELQGHGGPVVLDQLLKAVTSLEGVRIANPGEFSERAFLNDKMDLTQAEAIADLINATSEQAARNAVHSLQGVFSNKIHHLVEKLTHLRMYIEAAIDFPEEEIDFLNDETLFRGIDELEQALDSLFKEAQQGVILREGMTVVIAGKPNAGKSSLLNALAGRDSAIVTDIPGTTRDVLREHIHLDGMPLHIIDTAGLREGGDQVEQMGMQRAWSEIDKADRILLLIDAQEITLDRPLSLETLTGLIPQFGRENLEKSIDISRISVIYNKSDLIPNTTPLPDLGDTPQLFISAKQKTGLDELTQHLKSVMGYTKSNEGGFTARRRHLEALALAQQHIHHGHEQLNIGAGELVAEDLRQAQQALGNITGDVSPDELLGKIFSSFCIGK